MAKKAQIKASGISRRSLLKGIGAAAFAASVTPRILRAGDEKKEGQMILGSGEHTYEWKGTFGELPQGKRFGNTHGVQVDAQGRVFIHSQNTHGGESDSIFIFDGDGKFIKSWGKEYAAGAHGLQLVKEGKDEYLYLAATGQHIVAKTTLDGELLWKLTWPKECPAYKEEGQYVPTNVAVAANGDFYVADGYGAAWIHQYDKKAKYMRSFGGPGSEAGKLNCPHGIWIDTRGTDPLIVVADRSNVRLQYFSMDGKHVSFVKDELRHPCHFDQRNGELLIPDLHGRVTIFDKNNKLVCHLGDNPDPKKRGNNGVPPKEWADGQFCSPHGACWDKDGNIYVAEWLHEGRVTKLRKVGA